MKKPLSPAVAIGGIIGLLAVLALVFFLVAKSDPAAQAPNAPPRFDAAAKQEESMRAPTDRGPTAARPR